MNAVLYESNTGECRRIADYVGSLLGYPVLDIRAITEYTYENCVLVFPIHAEALPRGLSAILARIEAENTALLAAYGKMSYGNLLYECQRRYGFRVVFAAYLPTKHAYLPSDTRFSDFSVLDALKDALQDPHEIRIPKSRKNPFAGLFPLWRHRIGVRLIRGQACKACGACTAVCRHTSCIRCTACVCVCKSGALDVRLSLPMRLYLRKKPKNEIIIYQ